MFPKIKIKSFCILFIMLHWTYFNRALTPNSKKSALWHLIIPCCQSLPYCNIQDEHDWRRHHDIVLIKRILVSDISLNLMLFTSKEKISCSETMILFTWMIIPSSPSNTMCASTHFFSWAHKFRYGPTIGTFDNFGIILIVTS